MTVGASVIIRSPAVIEESKIIMISQLAQCSKYFTVQRKKKVRVDVDVCVFVPERGRYRARECACVGEKKR